MTDSTANLGYQLYFLFRTYWWKEAQLVREPVFSPTQFGSLGEIGIQIDRDKRLFCRTPRQTALADWRTFLQSSWLHILETYAHAFAPQDAVLGLKKARTFCADNLLGVALLITDDHLQAHEIIIDLYTSSSAPPMPIYFKCDQTVLLSIHDKPDEMPAPATFHAFKPTVGHQVLKADNWTLQLANANLPYLQSIKSLPNTSFNYPIFIVYGLAHGDAAGAEAQGRSWPYSLEKVLLHDVGEGVMKKTALLNSAIARFMISESVFEMLDWEARCFREELQLKTTQYALDAQNKRLQYEKPNKVLEQELRDMEELIANTDFHLGRINQAITTLQVNQENFEWRLNHLQLEALDWQIDWQLGHRYPPLLEPLYSDVKNLQTHITYIEGKLAHLKGLRNSWLSYINENRHNWTEHLGYLGHVIIFLLTILNTALNFDHPWMTWLRHPLPYLIVFAVYLIFLFQVPVKKISKWLRYHFYHRHSR
jgi:hypothetical protein